MQSEILGTKLKKTIYLDQFFPQNSSLFLYFHLTAEAKENFTISNYATLVFSELQKFSFLGCFSPALFQQSHLVSIEHF